MIVFIKNIPQETNRQDIIDLVMPVVMGGFFRLRGKISRVDILAIADNNTGLMEYHGLVHIVPDEVGHRVIRRLHGQYFKGKRVALREYVVRTWRNDRRDVSKPPVPVAVERRNGQVRRSNLKIQKLRAIKLE